MRALDRIVRQDGRFDFLAVSDPDKALTIINSQEPIAVALIDLVLPGISGLELLQKLKESRPDIEAVVMTAYGTIEKAVGAMRAGAYDFLTKPLEDPDVVLHTLNRAVERHRLVSRTRQLERQLEVTSRFAEVTGRSPQMREVLELVESVAPTDATVLLLGDSGVGKEVIARAIHRRSLRKDKPLLAVNCSALTETLLESELFGHMKGSFTGATVTRRGVFEEADGGTLFLDEIGDVSQNMQARLLRALQEGEIKPIGSSENRSVDVRVLAAATRDLASAVRDGKFREDLYYRLNVITIEIPPLRDRPDDIPALAQHFLRQFNERMQRPAQRFAPAALDRIFSYRWPGNVRELENAIERAVVLCKTEEIQAEHLPRDIRMTAPMTIPGRRDPLYDKPLGDARRGLVDSFERGYLEDVLSRASGRLSEAARMAGMDRSNFRRLLLRYGLGDSSGQA